MVAVDVKVKLSSIRVNLSEFRLAHKEERFLFVMYPLVCFGAAVTLVVLHSFIILLLHKVSPKGTKVTLRCFTMEK